MFAVIGMAWAFGSTGAKPYMGPVKKSKEEAVEAWASQAITNGKSIEQVNAAAFELRRQPSGADTTLYDGDEVVLVQEFYLS